MPTRQEVLTAIETINDQGNNTAQEVRTVLTTLLDYTENDENPTTNPSPSDFKTFHLWDEGVPLEDNRGGRLWYSFRGIDDTENGASVNFTFRLEIREANVNDPVFEVPDAVFAMLKDVVQTEQPMTFSVPMYHPQFDFPSVAVLRLIIKEPNQLGMIIDSEDRVLNQHTIYTSIAFHAPEFNF